MARWTRPHTRAKVVSAPVTVPLDLAHLQTAARPEHVAEWERTILATGGITPSKRPLDAVEIAVQLRQMSGAELGMVFAGGVADPALWARVQQRCLDYGLPVTLQKLDRAEMVEAYLGCQAAIVVTGLESLSFGLTEALALSSRVVASPLAVHLESARRIGRQPVWSHELKSDTQFDMEPRRPAHAMDEWRAVGEALGLPHC